MKTTSKVASNMVCAAKKRVHRRDQITRDTILKSSVATPERSVDIRPFPKRGGVVTNELIGASGEFDFG
jgi:hypothetical protein